MEETGRNLMEGDTWISGEERDVNFIEESGRNFPHESWFDLLVSFRSIHSRFRSFRMWGLFQKSPYKIPQRLYGHSRLWWNSKKLGSLKLRVYWCVSNSGTRNDWNQADSGKEEPRKIKIAAKFFLESVLRLSLRFQRIKRQLHRATISSFLFLHA